MEAAQGREVKYIKLYKPEGSSLGFSVVGLKSAHKGEPGIYAQKKKGLLAVRQQQAQSSQTGDYQPFYKQNTVQTFFSKV